MSNKEASQYPVSQQIEKVIRNSGYTPLGFLLATGHCDFDTELVLPRLESWLQKGQGDEAIIALFAAYDPDQAAALYKTLAETVAMQAAGIDPVAYEKERREKIKRDRFEPYIFAQGERTVPTRITMFGISGDTGAGTLFWSRQPFWSCRSKSNWHEFRR
jgi:hypothetical protein